VFVGPGNLDRIQRRDLPAGAVAHHHALVEGRETALDELLANLHAARLR